MSRAPVQVRDAVEGDAEALCRLWAEALPPDGEGAEAGQVALGALARVDGDPALRILVAHLDDRVVGTAYLRAERVSPVRDERVLSVSHLQADPDGGREGVERALLECAVSWAEECGIETIVTATVPSDRETNRFLARLGLAQGAVLRHATVAALRARLPHDPTAVARNGSRVARPVGQVVAARRSQRRARTRQLLL